MAGMMTDRFSERLRRCTTMPAILDCVLNYSIMATGTVLGNVQQLDPSTGTLRIAASHGFDREFLETFASVRSDDGSACGRAIAERSQIIIEDVHNDHAFSPYREVAERAGFRSVQSTPLISTSGEFVGMVSTHFSEPKRLDDLERLELLRIGQIAADAIKRATSLSAEREPSHRSPRSYLALLLRETDDIWRVELPDFPGCTGEAETVLAALNLASDAAQRLADELFDLGHRWPAPRSLQEIQEDILWSSSRMIWRNAVVTHATVLV
jgi:GAF domain-containing protein